MSTRRRMKRPNRQTNGAGAGWTATLVVIVIGVIVTIFFSSTDWRPSLLELLVGCVVLVAIVIGVVVLFSYVSGWKSLMHDPVRRFTQGDFGGAEEAFEKARAYARNLPSSDYRRGVMLYQLTVYLRAVRRHAETMAYFTEAAALLREHRDAQAPWYITALNDQACYGIHCRRFESAQRILEEVFDYLPVLKKSNRDAKHHRLTETSEIVLRINIAHVLTELGIRAQAQLQLDAARELLPTIPHNQRAATADVILWAACRQMLSAGEYDAADDSLTQADHPDHEASQQIRAAIHLARHNFEKAEQLARVAFANPAYLGETHRPETLELRLILADALFGQAKLDDAFKAFEEARSVVAEFAMPADDFWRNSLAAWLRRAKEAGRGHLAASLEEELAKAAASPIQAITVLDKFRIQPLGSD